MASAYVVVPVWCLYDACVHAHVLYSLLDRCHGRQGEHEFK